MRFDDTLETVLAADMDTPYGVQSLWRQLVDLIGRRRVAPDARAMAKLQAIRDQVPAPIRAASARALEFAQPPAPLVRLFALDTLAIAIPVLRSAVLTSSEWIHLLPELSPPARSVLRNRRDLGPIVKRALESFGKYDFVLPDATGGEAEQRVEAPIATDLAEAVQSEPVAAPAPLADIPEECPDVAEPEVVAREQPLETPAPAAQAPENEPEMLPVAHEDPGVSPDAVLADASAASEPEADAVALAPDEDYSFVALATGVPAPLPAKVPVEDEIMAAPVQSGTVGAEAVGEPVAEVPAEPQTEPMSEFETLVAQTPAEAAEDAEFDVGPLQFDSMPEANAEGTFEIAEVVARIDAFWRHREEKGPPPPRPPRAGDAFRFETDAKGVIRWVEGVSRAPVVGLSLDVQGPPAGSRVDGAATGAFRRRAAFATARLVIEGESDASGDWLISGVPAFDPANGRFTGYRGTARRPRVDERAEPLRAAPDESSADSLRQLVHELRTPTNAIAGFAEMIETQMLGPVSDPYRERANVIRAQARDLLGAIDDLDLAARIDSAALSLVPGLLTLRPLLTGIADDLAPLSEIRGSVIALPIDDLAVIGDRRAVERLLARLLATLVSASGAGERIGIHVAPEADDMVAITIDRPKALADYPGDSVLGIDDEHEDATLLGTGFALRLARNLARELGGSLTIAADSLTLRLPAAVNRAMGQANLN